MFCLNGGYLSPFLFKMQQIVSEDEVLSPLTRNTA